MIIIIPFIIISYYYYNYNNFLLSSSNHYYYYAESFPLLSRTTTNVLLWNHNNNNNNRIYLHNTNNNNRQRKINPIAVVRNMKNFKSNQNSNNNNNNKSKDYTNEIDNDDTKKTIRKSSIIRFITNPMCPYAQKVWLALECSKTLYQYEEISLYGTNGKPDWFWKLNPLGTIPVIVVIVIDDNNSIMTTKKKNDHDHDHRMMIYPDSDVILDQYLYQYDIDEKTTITTTTTMTSTTSTKIGRKRPSWEYHIPLVPPPSSDPYNDDIIIQSIKEWRSFINEQVIPIGKQYVLYPNQNNNKEKFISLLCDMNHRIINMRGLPSSSSNDTTNNTKYILSSYQYPTIIDCHAFPFVYRLYTQYDDNDNIMKQYSPDVIEWIEFCMKQTSFQKTIVSSWWWWW